ncbi:MAG: SRPBCC domain-containing protein [Ignavibacteria bacterium]|nr:SRPBCC domain-containing protein [Ignavibacteria bacterium]
MNYTQKIEVFASAESIFRALTTKEGIAGWWTSANSFILNDGNEYLSLDFGQVSKLMRVQKSELEFTLNWIVEECTLPEWPGTTITITLKPDMESHTLLQLVHDDLIPELKCYKSCAHGWEYFLASLKSFVETGKGHPYTP